MMLAPHMSSVMYPLGLPLTMNDTQTAGASATTGTLLASITNVISMGVGVQLMERAGRRLLLLVGMFGMGTSAMLISVAMIINVGVPPAFSSANIMLDLNCSQPLHRNMSIRSTPAWALSLLFSSCPSLASSK